MKNVDDSNFQNYDDFMKDHRIRKSIPNKRKEFLENTFEDIEKYIKDEIYKFDIKPSNHRL